MITKAMFSSVRTIEAPPKDSAGVTAARMLTALGDKSSRLPAKTCVCCEQTDQTRAL